MEQVVQHLKEGGGLPTLPVVDGAAPTAGDVPHGRARLLLNAFQQAFRGKLNPGKLGDPEYSEKVAVMQTLASALTFGGTPGHYSLDEYNTDFKPKFMESLSW